MDYNKLFLNGEWVPSESKEVILVENPYTKENIASVPRGNKKDVEKAIISSKEALKNWEETDLKFRVSLMERFLDNLEESKEEIAKCITLELGSPIRYSLKGHVESYLKEIKYFIDIAQNYDYEVKKSNYIERKEPVGIVGALTPWNYPFGQIILKIVPALLAGNTVILKPSQRAPLTAFHITKAIEKAEFPKGVFNLITGVGSEVGWEIANHEDVDLISFTGSTDGGISIGKTSMETIKNLTLELGGKSPSIIMDGANLEQAVKITLANIYTNSGQMCSALSRIIADKKIKKELEEKIIQVSKNYKVGDPMKEDTRMGPLISKSQLDKVSSFIKGAKEEGANLLIGGKSIKNTYLVEPTIFTDCNNNMTIAREEVFGPVGIIIYYDDIEEAIEIANDTEYGLSSAVFGPEDEAINVAKKLKAGQVKVNGGTGAVGAAFGGYKKSGIGRESGINGFEEYLETKIIFNGG